MKKRTFFPTLAIIAMVFMACEQKNLPTDETIPFNKGQLIGIWGHTSVDIDYDMEHDSLLMESCYVFDNEGKFEVLWSYTDDVQYYDGTLGCYTVTDSVINLFPKKTQQYFYKNGVLRISNIYEYNESDSGYLHISKFSQNKITLIDGNYTSYLYRLPNYPTEWNPVFFEPEKLVSENALIEHWGLVNYITEDGWWYYDYPGNTGIQLLAEGQVGEYFWFWRNWIYQKLIADGDITDQNELFIEKENCAWSLRDRIITLSCSSYDYSYNKNDGTYLRTVNLETPITADFTIYSFTEHFLILHSDYNDIYYIFSPGIEPVSFAPKNVKAQSIASTFIERHLLSSTLKHLYINTRYDATGKKVE